MVRGLGWLGSSGCSGGRSGRDGWGESSSWGSQAGEGGILTLEDSRGRALEANRGRQTVPGTVRQAVRDIRFS